MSHEEFPTDRPAVVTCGLPYANGDLHIGHLRGYAAADAVNRSLKKLGQQSAYVCGSDMHGTPIAVGAAQQGISPEEFAMPFHETYQETFPEFNVEFDNYGRTNDETNTELTRELVETLAAEGYVYEDEIMVAWDPEADEPLPDRYVEGTCPYCGAHARGDECDEGCGRHLEPGEIEDPVSTITGNPAEYREREHKYFAVSELAEYLSGFLDRLEGTSNARNQPREWLEEGLQDWCITRDMDWGVDYPGEDDLVLYVWVDAPIEYVSSTKQYSERVGADEYDWEEVWGRDGGDGGEIVHVIGRDIIQHHTVFWPAMLHATGHAEPRAVCATGFVTIDGKGLSTSRNRAIWAEEYLDEGFHPDLLRYYLTTMGGFQQDLDFTWERFQERVNGELVGTVGNFVYRSMLFAARNFDGTPDAAVSDEVRAEIDAAVEQFESAVREYDVRNAGDAAVELAQFGNEYIQQHEPWQLEDGSDEQARVIRDCLQVATAVAVLLEPICPEKAETVWDQLSVDADVHDAETDAVYAEPGAFDEPDELFEKIEDDRVDDLDAALEAKIEEAAADEDDDSEDADEADTEDPAMDASDIEPLIDERIDFDTFQSLDIRVGRIESAEGIEGADELVRLEVDIGAESRQIVAGLKQLHDVDELAGETVIVLANLEKAELFGVESDGMVLAAGDEADLLTTHDDAEPGEKVL